MKTKCHYKGPEFVPCEKMTKAIENELLTDIYGGLPDECPFCGASLAKPEEKKPWWLVQGALIKDENNIIYQIDAKKDIRGFTGRDNIKPIGGPFDMIPERFDNIYFKSDGSGHFGCEYHYTKKDFPVWHNCPEEFKCKTFSLGRS